MTVVGGFFLSFFSIRQGSCLVCRRFQKGSRACFRMREKSDKNIRCMSCISDSCSPIFHHHTIHLPDTISSRCVCTLTLLTRSLKQRMLLLPDFRSSSYRLPNTMCTPTLPHGLLKHVARYLIYFRLPCFTSSCRAVYFILYHKITLCAHTDPSDIRNFFCLGW